MEGRSTGQVAFHFDSVVEIGLKTGLQSDRATVALRLRNSDFKKALVDELMIARLILLARMENVHLQGQKRQLKLVGDEGEGLRGVLLTHSSGVFPATSRKCILQMFRLEGGVR